MLFAINFTSLFKMLADQQDLSSGILPSMLFVSTKDYD